MKAELLKRFFRAITSSDQEAIDKLTYLVIEDERNRGHTLLADHPEASVPYSLVVSFEAIQADIPIYTPFIEAQVETEVQPLIEIQSIVVS